jgi:hypothetical protein
MFNLIKYSNFEKQYSNFFFENKYSKKEKKFKIPDLKRIKTILLFEKRKYVNRKEKIE